MSTARVLIVVPTLGRRPEMLRQCLVSIASQSERADIVLVGPQGNEAVSRAAHEFGAVLVTDPGSLARAINVGVERAAAHHQYMNWLGDDDLLEPGSLAMTVAALDAQSDAVLAFGACRYIDNQGNQLWISRAGSWAPRILSWGPDLIPQPGMLVRTSAWQAVGGLDEKFRFAFDLDLLLKLRKIGHFVDVDAVVSSFRWHSDSLTVSDRTQSLDESDFARKRSLSPGARKLAWLWVKPMRMATRVAAWEVNRRAQKLIVKAHD